VLATSLDALSLDAIPLWAMFAGTIGLSLLGLELGYRLGRWRHRRRADEKEAPVGAMAASVLGLLAILIAFAFNLAAARFDDRRQTVLEEANAIGTTYLRARLLPEPERTECERLLREYVETRVDMIARRQIAEGIAHSEQLHEELWKQAITAAEKSPGSIMTGLFIQSLNGMIDIHARRVLVGLRSRMPLPIWFGIYALAVVGMISMGYQAGLSATPRTPAEVLLAVAFAGALFLVIDLDRGHEGFVTVSQAAMLDLQKSMHMSSPSKAPVGASLTGTEATRP
jgi:hypothetical protein